MIADETAASIIRVPCPGWAHQIGEECLICDEENDGTISVVITEVEQEALACAARGRPVDTTLAPRLRRLDLLHDVAGYTIPTENGFALLGSAALRSN